MAIEEHFAAVGLAEQRFVSVHDGGKMCVDHDTRYDDPADVPGTNYGIYAAEDDDLVILDVDQHRGGEDNGSVVAVAALEALPETLEMESPHVPAEGRGGHIVLKLRGDETPAELFDRRFGPKNPMPSWGEVIAKNKYVVGPGSQLDGCDKDWCTECGEPDGGRYTVGNDKPIAEVNPETLIEALAADPELEDAEAAGDTQTLDDVDGSGGSGDADGRGADETEEYDELDRETVEEILEEIPGDQRFDDWIRTGYAVHDWDDGDEGKEVFESWSKENEKWEREESQKNIDYIWGNNKSRSDDSKATVGTLIHLGQEHGWGAGETVPTPKELVVEYSDKYDDPAAVPDGLVADEPPADDADDDDADDGEANDNVPDWSDVRTLYEMAVEEDSYPKGPARKTAADVLMSETSWMYVLESERLWVYKAETGVYERFGAARVAALLKEKLGPHYSQSERREIVGHLEAAAENQTHRDELNARGHDAPLVCVGDGVVNLETGERLEHAPEYRFIRGLQWAYDTDGADPEPVREFLDEVTEREADRDTLLDHLAHGLMPGHPYRAFVVAYGPGGNGKTQVSEVFRGFVGSENAAAVEIDELTADDFATGDLPGKFLNWGDDMAGDGGGTLEELSLLKKSTGGSEIRANEKYEKTFDFKNQAAMFFSANEPPRIGEQKRSIQDRIYPIEMPYRFVREPDPDDQMEKEKVPNISETLLSDDAAMRGLLQLAVEHAQGLIESRGEYAQPESPEERLQKYNQSADPIARFASRAVEPAGGDSAVRKDDVYRIYRAFADEWEERGASQRGFKRQFPKAFAEEIETARSRTLANPDDENDRVKCWKRVAWTETGRAKMPDWMAERYAGHFDDAAGDESESDDQPTPLASLDVGRYSDIVAEFAAVSSGEYTREAQGELKGQHGTYVGFVIPGDNEDVAGAYEGETVRLENVTMRTDDDGLREVVINDATTVTPIGDGEQTAVQASGDLAASDGGQPSTSTNGTDLEGAKGRVHEYLRTNHESGDTVAAAAIAGTPAVDVSPERAATALDQLASQGYVTEASEGYEVIDV